MRILKLSLALLFGLQSALSAGQEKPTVESAAWLSGCWEGQANGKEFSEQWMRPKADAMLGMGRTIANNRMVDYEFTQIRKEKDGEIYYVAHPARQPEASFRLTRVGPKELIFENPEHDFPQRIIYRLVGDDSLMARIEGKNEGKDLGMDFPMKRVRCE